MIGSRRNDFIFLISFPVGEIWSINPGSESERIFFHFIANLFVAKNIANKYTNFMKIKHSCIKIFLSVFPVKVQSI